MNTTLNLNTGQLFWFTADSSIHLSEENPGPVDIEFSKLPREHQYTIILGVKNNQIQSSVDVKNLMDVYSGSVPAQPVVLNTDEETPLVESEQDRKQTAIKVLAKTPATIKKHVANEQDIRVLRLMLELELSTRNRAPIVSALQSKLEVLYTAVSNSIAKDNSPAIKATSYVDPLADALDVTESEVEQVTFKLPEDDNQ